jgi:hypothetical protein
LKDLERAYGVLMAQDSLDRVAADRALRLIGMLTAVSLDLRRRDGLERAARLGRELWGRDLPSWQRATADYFVANAWSGLRLLSVEPEGGLEMEQPELEKETFHLRRAIGRAREGAVRKQRLCQMLTNLGNSMSYAGRITEPSSIATAPSVCSLGSRWRWATGDTAW